MATKGLSHSVFEGAIATPDMEIERRPYHRNCSCALHKSGDCTKSSPCNTKISYPVRRSWSDGCLALASSNYSSPSSSPANPIGAERTQLALCKKEIV
ncbi:uncharacterized protein LOC143879496 [Tasmannia lanceolata]|uniref:uncharacterized protein LOC143879496 n=1 Tax=Tasmannia lanceolata TaxID=3420 RepID=UPI004063305F